MDKVLEMIPYDVWSNISRFIPRDALSSLATVNRTFSILAAQARYEVVTFCKFDHDTELLCQYLTKPNFGRGHFVRRVNIKPWLVQPCAKSSYSPFDSLRKFTRGVFDPDSQKRPLNRRNIKRIQKDINCIADAVVGLKNLTEYSLDWDPHRPYHPELFQAFLCPVLSHTGSKLVKLSLTVPPEMLSSLAPTALPHLEYLEVSVCTLEMPRRDIDVIIDSFTVFVNNLYPSLRSLSLSSRVPSHFVDFTRFFTHLGTFPHLHTFRLSMPFDGSHLSIPSSLVVFLNKHHKTLQNLQLSTSRCSPTDTPLDPSLKYWIPNILSSFVNPFPCLRGLQLALRPLKADLTPIANFLGQCAPTLNSLTFTDRQLTFEEVAMIVDALADPTGEARELRQLHLQVLYFSPALLNLLAAKLPRLVLLEISFSEVVAAVPSHSLCHSQKLHLEMFQHKLRANRQNFCQWTLGTISIPGGLLACPWWHELSSVFLECIPALHTVMEMNLAQRGSGTALFQ